MDNINIEQLRERLLLLKQEVGFLLPEISVVILLVALLLLHILYKRGYSQLMPFTVIIGLVVVMGTAFEGWSKIQGSSYLFMSDMLRVDSLSAFFRVIAVAGGIITVLLGWPNVERQKKAPPGEFFVLLCGLLLGVQLMAMSVNLLTVYVSIELVSICSYALTYFSFRREGAEASMKYLIFGAVSSAFMLYGISLIYGFTGTLAFTSIDFGRSLLLALLEEPLPIILASFMVLGGFLFKVGTAPFHVWVPDVYQGGPTPLVAFLSVVPKLAGIVLVIRFLASFEYVSLVFVDSHFDWQMVLGVFAMAAMIIGNFSAIWQKNAKRMLAYSSIAHSGFLLAGVLAYSELGVQSVMFYGVIYLLMNFAAFLLVMVAKDQTGSEELEAMKGLGRTYPFVGILFLIVMLALTGLPPTAGFTAKVLIFSSIWEAYELSNNTMLLLLFIVGLFNTVVALFYYLKIPLYMFVFEENGMSFKRQITVIQLVLGTVLVIPLLGFFLWADKLMDFVNLIKFAF